MLDQSVSFELVAKTIEDVDICQLDSSFDFLGHGKLVSSLDPFGLPEPDVSPASDQDTSDSESDEPEGKQRPLPASPSESPTKKQRNRKSKAVKEKERVAHNARRELDREIYGRAHSATERLNYSKEVHNRKKSSVFQSASLAVTEGIAEDDYNRTAPGFTGPQAAHRAVWNEQLDARRRDPARSQSSSSTKPPITSHTAAPSSTLYQKMVEEIPDDDMGEQDMDISPILSPLPNTDSMPSISSLTDPPVTSEGLSESQRLYRLFLSGQAKAAPTTDASGLHILCDKEVKRMVEEEGYKYFPRDEK